MNYLSDYTGLTPDTVYTYIYRQICSHRFIALNITHLKPDYFCFKIRLSEHINYGHIPRQHGSPWGISALNSD